MHGMLKHRMPSRDALSGILLEFAVLPSVGISPLCFPHMLFRWESLGERMGCQSAVGLSWLDGSYGKRRQQGKRAMRFPDRVRLPLL